MRYFLPFLSFLFLFFSCKAPEARKPVSISSGSFISESINRNKELSAREEARIQKIIQQDSVHNYIVSDGGFWYYYNVKDTLSSVTPKFGDIVNFNYDVKDLSGNIIYNQKELDTINYAIDKEELFFGLREGLKLMKAGETVTFLFPSYQAYGYYGDDNKIGTNIPLISNVTLNRITKQSTKEN
ncbi:gliding motility-associated peptidyl-prolyl isomerase GldI [Aquimarina sp. 2201CG14-23]|uniref:gliding motility-associated peptidyl-prolyl isomerase GldI n=1 Tax=Aquimarina mycalae TaxID=3040073 RepID=UPI0024782708|nr:gliding motility-associated peptidyl-prolyl isomerase GldI [Aquimarina sp. 2201CG14-23]MDH7444273.1 gliding motility-associated peptidyl-prolyl isomerase GldI [Aquimarina sp. 2201CG14-23]